MFEQITQWTKNSETIKEARIGNKGYPFWKEVVKFILLMILTEFIITGIIDAPLILSKIDANLSVLIQLFSTVIFIGIYLLFILKVEKRNLRSVGFSKDNILSSYAKGFLIAFVMISIIIIVGLLLGEYKFESFNLK